MQFESTVGVVTGAASGLGAATAAQFAAAGAVVVVADRDADRAAAVAASIVSAGHRADAFHVDVGDETAVDGLFEHVRARYGRLDWAHNNAGVEGPMSATATTTLDDWNEVLRVNLTGIFLCMRAELRIMVEAGSGAIVNTASIDSFIAHRNTAAYSASKAGVMGLTRAAALEHASDAIRINSVCPGWMATPMVTERASALLGRDLLETAASQIPMGRVGDPAEVAKLVVWLASSDNSYLTGQGIVIDGGYTAA